MPRSPFAGNPDHVVTADNDWMSGLSWWNCTCGAGGYELRFWLAVNAASAHATNPLCNDGEAP